MVTTILLLAAGRAIADGDPESSAGDNKDIFGWIERVELRPRNLVLEAKLDTGADTSSLHATHIRRVRVGEKRYVRFAIEDPETGNLVEMRRPLVRRVRIKRHEGEHQRRPVVIMDVCLGTHLLRDVEFSLVDRSVFDYPVLLGRSALEDVALVDPSEQRTQRPECSRAEGP